MPDLAIQSLRGGINEDDFPIGQADDQCDVAINVEFYHASLGERRLGCQAFDMTGSGLTGQTEMVHLSERSPSNDITQPEHWAIAATPGGAIAAKVARYAFGAWAPVVPSDDILTAKPDIYRIQSQELNGKLFYAYHSAVDRLHVWDGSQWRKTGLKEPAAAPTAVDEGVGTFAEIRYYRIRYIKKDGSQILLRSEPSAALTFTPSGVGAGATITRPAVINEGETHWELEASDDGAFFWRIQTIVLATTTATDETVFLTDGSYDAQGPLSEPIGDYLLQPSVRYIAADADRLLMAGHWTDETRKSRVAWSPVFADPGAGNDERLPLSEGGDNYVDLDNYEGGGLTAIGQVSNGTWYAFKWHHIYRLTRTGDITHAYDPVCVSKVRGAYPDSVVQGIDEAGRACLYFLDPGIGVCSLGAYGLRDHKGQRKTWQRVNFVPEGITCRAVYYPDKQQVHWWVAIDGGTTPSLKIVLQVNDIQTVGGGSAGRGFVQANGKIATAYCASIWHEITSDGVVQKLHARPFIGLPAPDFIQRCDVQDDDAGVQYFAKIRTKPFLVAGLLNFWGSMTTAFLATAQTVATLVVSCVRDFGLEQNDRLSDMAPVGTEPYVIKRLDDLVMSEATAIQFQFADPQ